MIETMHYGINRRRLLKAGLVGAAVTALPSRLFAAGNVRNSVPAGLLGRAKAALESHPGLKRDVIAIADFSRPSSDRRFHIVNLGDGRVDSLLVTHGRGSDPTHSGWLQHFSNRPGSEASSSGAFRTEGTYIGKHGRSRRLAGLDPSNSNAASRAIVVHGAWYADPEMLLTRGKLGRSEGCFAVQEGIVSALIDRLGEGRLIYADRLA